MTKGAFIVKIRSWIRYFCQENNAKGIAIVFLVLGVFFIPKGNLYGFECLDYLPAISYGLVLAGIGLAHVFNFMSMYKSWPSPTRVILLLGGFAAALAIPLCNASLSFFFFLFLPIQTFWNFLEQDRKDDEAAFKTEIEAAWEKDRKAAEEKEKNKKRKNNERPRGLHQ